MGGLGEKNEGRQDRRCSEERHHRICDERVRERGLPVSKQLKVTVAEERKKRKIEMTYGQKTALLT